jgi:hypothetical protein
VSTNTTGKHSHTVGGYVSGTGNTIGITGETASTGGVQANRRDGRRQPDRFPVVTAASSAARLRHVRCVRACVTGATAIDGRDHNRRGQSGLRRDSLHHQIRVTHGQP